MFGVLQLSSNKTYGRQVKANGKQGKLYYEVKPIDKESMICKVPYEPKFQGNSRVLEDKYVEYTITEPHNPDNALVANERPLGVLTETFGDVSDLNSLIAFNFRRKALSMKSHLGKMKGSVADYKAYKKECVEKFKRTYGRMKKEPIRLMSIDPEGCVDIDDAVGIVPNAYGAYDVVVAITHVPSYLNGLSLSEQDLDYLLRNPTSVYLPDKTCHMFDAKFGQNVLSLNAGEESVALCLKIQVARNWSISDIRLSIETVYITKNFSYEQPELLESTVYKKLLDTVRYLNLHYPRPFVKGIKDSHDVIAYLMVFMNVHCARVFDEYSHMAPFSILRTVERKAIDSLPSRLGELRGLLEGRSSSYIHVGEADGTRYTHITSPMRRLIDLANMITVTMLIDERDGTGLIGPPSVVNTLVNRVSRGLEGLNERYKYIRKMSMDIDLIDTIEHDDTILAKSLKGIIVEKDDKQLVVYLTDVKRLFRIKEASCLGGEFNETHTLWSEINCSLIEFPTETKITKRFRLVEKPTE